MSNISLEKFFRIYNDKTGDFIEVREDCDSLALVEIVQEKSIITITVEVAEVLVEVLPEIINHIKNNQGSNST